MIIEFSIQNFGSIKEKQTISFEATKSKKLEDDYVIQTENGLRLLKVAMIYGANASGKTTILEALDFLRELVLKPLDRKNEEMDFDPFLFDIDKLIENSFLSISFLHRNIRYDYSIEFNRYAIVNEELYYYKPNRALVFKRTTDLQKQLTNIDFGSKIKSDNTFNKILTANTLWNNTVLGGYLKTNLENTEMRAVFDWFTSYLKKTITPNSDLRNYVTTLIHQSKIKSEKIVQILQKADLQISNVLIKEEVEEITEGFIRLLEKQSNVTKEQIDKLLEEGKITSLDIEMEHLVDGNSYKLPFDKESQGTQRYFGFAGILALLINESTLFPIDELETSLHPDLYLHFLLSFLHNSKKSQLLFTTHNREILNNRDLFRDDAIWFTEKENNSGTNLYSLADFDSSIVRDTNNVYNAYKIGKLGGVPNLGDYYIDTNEEN